ncbi:MAG TPA: DUF3305 domain-containing protein [Usitatibacter sp.]|nr:DUF3305 domain-containing protein [Usitatibacter sp.]
MAAREFPYSGAMDGHPTRKISVVLERHVVGSRWETHRWVLAGVAPDEGGEARIVAEDEAMVRRLHPGIEVALFPGEAEGYYLNATSVEPSVFVALRIDEATGDCYPYQATLSYNEAARWMDGAERVERVPAWPDLALWLAQWVEANFRPEPRERRKPRSFVGKEGRLREEGSG